MPRYASPEEPLPPELARAVRVFGANPIRAAIVRLLATSPEPLTTGDIEKALGGASHRTIFHHVRELEEKGAVTSDARDDRNGQRVRYTVDRDAIRRELNEYAMYLLGESPEGDRAT
jgi:DNA-binding transcriptional ArsR family regulator